MTKRQAVLIVEDESDLAELLRHNIEREGHTCRLASDGHVAVAEAVKNPPDLVILDRMLPGMSGDDVITHLRRDPRTSSVPILMLTAKADEADELVGFALGADDYVTKPFSMKLLLARMTAMFRRRETADRNPEVLMMGPVRLDTARHELVVDDQTIVATATEFRLLKTLMKANGRVLSRGQLIDSALGSDAVVTDRTIDVHVTALRKKMGPAARWIQTVRGIGYTFRAPS